MEIRFVIGIEVCFVRTRNMARVIEGAVNGLFLDGNQLLEKFTKELSLNASAKY